MEDRHETRRFLSIEGSEALGGLREIRLEAMGKSTPLREVGLCVGMGRRRSQKYPRKTTLKKIKTKACVFLMNRVSKFPSKEPGDMPHEP